MDTLLIYITRIQILLGCLFYMLCCMRPTKLICIPALLLESGRNVM